MVVPIATQAQQLGLGKNYTSVAANPSAGGDASYLAYLRGLGYQESNVLNAGLENVGLANSQADLQQTDLAQRGTEQRLRIGAGMEARGLYRSGELLHNMSQQLAAEQRARADIASANARRLAAIRQGVALNIGTFGMQRADAEANLAGRLAAKGVKPVTNVSSPTYNIFATGATPTPGPKLPNLSNGI